ncbi:hypothetical protein ABTW96_08685 [Nocardia beijingensis]|uniref:hypothetical protein n=1 Tax=Nocardia beijingensis TaxID=95162 RepID=UPI0033263639
MPVRVLVMTVLSGIHALWTEDSLSLAAAAEFGVFWLIVVGCLPVCLRHLEIRMILREARSGSRVVCLSCGGSSMSACTVEVGAGTGERSAAPVLPPAWELPSV